MTLSQERILATEIPGPRSQALQARKMAAVSAGVGTTLPVYVEQVADATTTVLMRDTDRWPANGGGGYAPYIQQIGSASLRNGVLAITRDGRLAAINPPAYRILGVEPSSRHTGRPVAELLVGLIEAERSPSR